MAAWLLLIATACTSKRTADFDSADPGDKLYAIRASTASGDGPESSRRVVQYLVEQLDSDDPAVRMMAIIALEKITGERKGYDPYAERRQRHASIDAWVHALDSGELSGVGTSSGEPAITQGQADGSK